MLDFQKFGVRLHRTDKFGDYSIYGTYFQMFYEATDEQDASVRAKQDFGPGFAVSEVLGPFDNLSLAST